MSEVAVERDRLRQDARRIEELLGQVEAMVGQPAWQRVEELVQTLVSLYGAGLGRLLELATSSGDGEALAAHLRRDELVSSLLLLHGLHPQSPAERARDALAELGRAFDARLELVALDDGVASVQLTRGEVSQAAVERAIRDAAPEVSRVMVERPGGAGDLVQIDLHRSRRGK